jgi:hypothetical protein
MPVFRTSFFTHQINNSSLLHSSSLSLGKKLYFSFLFQLQIMADRILTVKFAGRMIDLLGQQMYGGAVPSVAELVANAWDADAEKVEITLPPDVKSPGAEIVVRDYGSGMSFEELNTFYLHIGYERRTRGERTQGGRLVMGRKGIGKLAGFGIAENIHVKSVKGGHLVEIILNYSTLRNAPTTSDFELIPIKDEPSDEPDGVTIIFKHLKLLRSINVNSFQESMARRFALGSDTMQIMVNGTPITKQDMAFEYRYPENGWQEEEIPNFGRIHYWFAFLNSTVSDTELRGVSIFARNRIAQFTPFFFNLTGGINGQVALEYLTGQIKADLLDEDMDYIATDRQTVNWQFGHAPYFEEWGRNKIKELCTDWKKRHDKKNVDRFQHRMGDFFLRIENLSSIQEKKDLTTALNKIASIERLNEEDFRIIANSMISGVERESVKKVIQRINAASDDALPELYEAIKEWDIISAVSTAEVIAGKLEIIKQFRKHIDNRLPEKAKGDLPDMQKFIKQYPWILGNDYSDLEEADFHHEHGVDRWISEVIIEDGADFTTDGIERRRFDLLVIKNNWRIVILELMRPGLTADLDHVNRLLAYVTRVTDALHRKGTLEKFRSMSVYGLLIADKFADSGSLKMLIQNNRNLIDAVEWGALFDLASAHYREFYGLLKNKAPEDSRLSGLIRMDV